MTKLLKLYFFDYLKKLIITFVLSILVGIVLFYPLAENITEQIIFTNWALYIAMYGVFFYHFPLTNIVKWSVNLPLKKRDLIIFNFSYQFLKIVATGACLFFAFWAEYQLFNNNIYVGQINDNIQILKDYILHRNLSILRKNFLPSTNLMVLILSVSFLFTFIFNVAPYGPFKNKLITFRDSINFLKFKFKTMGSQLIYFFLALVALIFLLPFIYSKAFIAGVFVSGMLLTLYFTYEKALIFSKETRFYCTSMAIFIGLFTWAGLMNYSKKILERPDLKMVEQIEEWEFLHRPHFGKNPVQTLATYLSNPDLCDDDIRKIFFYFRKKYHIAVKNIFNYPNTFENVILSKGECGLRAISKTIDPERMTVLMFIQFFDKWKQTSLTYSPVKYQEIIKPFLEKNFLDGELVELIKSGNPLAQYFVIEKLKLNPSLISHHQLEKLIPYFKEEGILSLQLYLKSNFCQYLTMDELRNNQVRILHQCRRQRAISSVLDAPVI